MEIKIIANNVFKNYAKIHSERNLGQSIEFTNIMENINKKKLFIGLVDNQNNIYAGSVLIIEKINATTNKAYAPDGFLIDYTDYSLVETFTKELIKFLKKENICFLITDPTFPIRIYNKKNNIIKNNEGYLSNLYRLGYMNNGYSSKFSKYDVVIDNNTSINDIYNNFNRNTKRNINNAASIGIKLVKGNNNSLFDAFNIFRKKTNNTIEYYRNLANSFSTDDNKLELFYTVLNPQKYLEYIKKRYEKEKRLNEKINNQFKKSLTKKDSLFNKKNNSDKTLAKYHTELTNAIKINNTYNEEKIIATSIVIRNNKEIYFLIDGYKEEFRNIYSSHMLKWNIIKKYYSLGYRKFNLGEISDDYHNINSKYHGQYEYKMGFGGNIYEYPPELMLVINKPLYKLYEALNKIKKK